MQQHRPRSDRSRRVAAALALLMIGGACVQQDDPGVAVETFEADLVFGVDEPTAGAAPPNSPAAPAVTGPAPAAPRAELPEFEQNDKGFLSRIPALRQQVPCPPARREAFPAEEAGLTVKRLPEVGLARWKQYGTQKITGIEEEMPVQGFENRTVQDVELVRGTAEEPLEFTYRTVQEDFFTDAIVVSRFRVTTDAVQRQADSRTEIATGRVVRTGEPDRGLALEAIEYIDRRSGDLVAASEFSPPILYIPLEIVPGESFEAAGVDVRSGSTLRHEATVVKRTRVDACGDVVDGWLVEATQTFSGPTGTFTRTYNYVVATQRGGVIISEHVEGPTQGGSASVTFDLGQLKLSPLPEEAVG